MSQLDQVTRTQLRESLQFLAEPTAEIPVGLPNFAMFIAQAWQQLITANDGE